MFSSTSLLLVDTFSFVLAVYLFTSSVVSSNCLHIGAFISMGWIPESGLGKLQLHN